MRADGRRRVEAMNAAEATFVANFIRKDRRERAIFELGSASKRGKFINRLCHDFSGVFDPRFLHPLPELGFDPGALVKRLRTLGAGSECHVISSNDAVDGQRMALEGAVRATVGFGLPSILICIPDSLCYFEAEQERGAAPRFLLLKKDSA